MNLWNESVMAYETYNNEFKTYSKSAKLLLEEVDVYEKIVLDLACGTGISTLEILKKNPKMIYCVDKSKAMLDFARDRIRYENVEFFLCSAEEISKVFEKMDVVLCNSAFWQFKSDLVFEEIYKTLPKDGIFAYSILSRFSPVFLDKKFEVERNRFIKKYLIALKVACEKNQIQFPKKENLGKKGQRLSMLNILKKKDSA
ncbi:MAG: class I SAM-dependent methyltransferase [Methanosarcinales archaeon]